MVGRLNKATYEKNYLRTFIMKGIEFAKKRKMHFYINFSKRSKIWCKPCISSIFWDGIHTFWMLLLFLKERVR